MITVTAEQTVRPGAEYEVDALMRTLAETVLHNEPGCMRFEYVVDTADPRRRLVIESYRDEKAFDFHRSTRYLADFIPQLLARLERPPVVVRFENAFARVSAATFFHTGIVVADLAAAVAYYSDSLGVAFTEPGTFVIPRLEDPEPHPFELTAALSRTDPPYLELIQAAGDGIVSLAHAGGILYHGYWEPDMAARYHWLTTEGPGVAATFRMEQGAVPFSMISAADRYGNRFEYVGTDAADPMTEWVRTGVLPSGIGS